MTGPSDEELIEVEDEEFIDAPARMSRRALVAWITGGLIAGLGVGVGGFELVNHGVLPGRQLLNQIDGTCSVPAPVLSFAPLGPSQSGTFMSAARHRRVGYTIAYPPGHKPGDQLPLIVMLHGFGDDHSTALRGMTPAQAVALRVGGAALSPMAIVTVDGGDGYWNPHPGDDPLAMVVHELIPMCRRRGLGVAPQPIGMMGVSMGGYGALEIAERAPGLVTAVAAISPAIWTSFEQAQAASPGAFSSASAFAAGDVITHAAALRDIPVRVASGLDDPFRPGVKDLIKALPPGSSAEIGPGCHTDPFFFSQEPPSLDFLSRFLRV